MCFKENKEDTFKTKEAYYTVIQILDNILINILNELSSVTSEEEEEIEELKQINREIMSRGKRIRRLKRELKSTSINKVLITYCNQNNNYYNKLKLYLEDSSTGNKQEN